MKLKRLLTFAIAVMTVLTLSTTALAADNQPVFAPKTSPKGVLVDRQVKQYVDENSYTITETTEVYANQSNSLDLNRTSLMVASNSYDMKTIYKTTSVSASGYGEVLTIQLDADFYYNKDDDVYCPRYFSSYDVLVPSQVVSYSETDMQQTILGKGTATVTARIKTYYEVTVKNGFLPDKTVRPTLSVACTQLGVAK